MLLLPAVHFIHIAEPRPGILGFGRGAGVGITVYLVLPLEPFHVITESIEETLDSLR